MEQTLSTPRLKLTLITTAERGSQELEWLHELRSDPQTTWWSIYGRSKTLEDTEKVMKNSLPLPTHEGGNAKTYRVVYAVHELTPTSSRLIGLITLRSLGPNDLALPAHIFPPSSLFPSCLTMELGYQFLPAAWGKGYATESLTAVFGACAQEKSFWEPYAKVFVRAIVNDENPASQRVMAKCGVPELGVHVWGGEGLWLAGRWRTTDSLHIFGKFVVE